jgi:signal transduction histidine kinase/ActR/RegA family two-component response regulator
MLRALTADLHGIAGGAQTHTADLTARAAFHQLQQSRMEAERAEEKAVDTVRAKDHFLAVLGHELRTPLTPILMITSALLDDPGTPDKLRGHLEVILRNLKQETRLIDDLLDVQRVSQGKLRLQREVVDAHKLLGQALETDRSTLRDAGIEVVVDLVAPESLLEADSTRLLQIIGNLIQNAAKFTPEGGTLTVRTRTEGAPGDRRWVAEFEDTGAGIEPDLLPRIFEAFEQGKVESRGRAQGLGLGLAICQSLVEAHGGRLSATSPGREQGTTFTLEFPTVSTPVVEPKPATPSTAAAPRRGLKVLLVEDHADIMRYLALMLRGRGHEVTTAATLAAARTAAALEAFDLLVSDIELPDGTGLELMRELGGSRRVTGIACSGFGSVEDVEQSREAGFAAHLTKPIEVRLLEETINRVVPAARGVGAGV